MVSYQHKTVEAGGGSPEEELALAKERVLKMAEQLKNGFFSDDQNVIHVSAYRQANKNLSLNKHRVGWFSQVGLLVQETQILPGEDLLIHRMPEITKQMRIIKENLQLRAKFEREYVNKQIWEDKDFKDMISKYGLEKSDGWFLFLFMIGDDVEGAINHLWVFKSVHDGFKEDESKFREWFLPLFRRWQSRLVGLRDEYMKMSSESVAAGDAILDIVISELTKK